MNTMGYVIVCCAAGVLTACAGEPETVGKPEEMVLAGPDGADGADGADGTDGTDGADGLACWDANADGACDLDAEDVNADGICDQFDCVGPQGPAGDDALWVTSGTDMFYADGDVGIGNASPQGLLHVSGPIRSGAETGTAEGPAGNLSAYRGMVVRRAVSLAPTDGNIVARTNVLSLERDGTPGGLILRWGPTTEAILQGYGYIIKRNGVMAPVRVEALNQFNGGSLRVTDDVDNVVHLEFTFGNFHNASHTTEVTLSRSGIAGSPRWVGTLRSTFDQ